MIRTFLYLVGFRKPLACQEKRVLFMAASREGDGMENAWNTEVWQAFSTGTITRAWRDVLLRMQHFRGRGGLIFPSHETLAAKAKCCVRTVQRALNAARESGLLSWVERRKRVGAGTERTSNLYTLIVKTPGKPPTGQGVRVASQKNPFLLTVGPDSYDARLALAAVLAERQRKIAQEWRDRRNRVANGRARDVGIDPLPDEVVEK